MRLQLLLVLFGIVCVAQTIPDATFKKDIVGFSRALRACMEDTQRDPPVVKGGQEFHDAFDAAAVLVAVGLLERGYQKESTEVHFITEIRTCESPNIKYTIIPILDRIAGYL